MIKLVKEVKNPTLHAVVVIAGVKHQAVGVRDETTISLVIEKLDAKPPFEAHCQISIDGKDYEYFGTFNDELILI